MAKNEKNAEVVTTEKTETNKTQKSDKVYTSASATLNNLGVTPRKVRLVIDLIRGKNIEKAYDILNNTPKASALPIKKLIKSAEANAVNNNHMEQSTLYIAEIYANDGMKLKRIRPRAKGSASRILKRWSNVTVTLKNREAK